MEGFTGKTANIFMLPKFNLNVSQNLALIATSGNYIFEMFHANFPFLYTLNKSENQT